MKRFSIAELEAKYGISRVIVTEVVKAGFVVPQRGPRREYLFTFQDVVILKMLRELRDARVGPRRAARFLAQLRRELPSAIPLAGLRISAAGSDLFVREGALDSEDKAGGMGSCAPARLRSDSGQYLFDFGVAAEAGAVRFLAFPPPASSASQGADHWFEKAVSLEASDPYRAMDCYCQAIRLDPSSLRSPLNLSYMLLGAGRFAEAHDVCIAALNRKPAAELAPLYFNLGIACEETNRPLEAIDAYSAALFLDPAFADAHYNVALVHEAVGGAKDALRHLNAYRRLRRDAK